MKKLLLITLPWLLLTGCSSLSQQECINADWHHLGYTHGARGYQYETGLDIVASCQEFGIRPDLALYQESYEQGLTSYCVPENGYALGLKGNPYNSVCNSRAFRQAWEEGHDRYQAQKRLDDIDYRLREIDQRLKDISRELNAANTEDSQRKELRNERRRLQNEQDDLRRERSLLPLLNKVIDTL